MKKDANENAELMELEHPVPPAAKVSMQGAILFSIIGLLLGVLLQSALLPRLQPIQNISQTSVCSFNQTTNALACHKANATESNQVLTELNSPIISQIRTNSIAALVIFVIIALVAYNSYLNLETGSLLNIYFFQITSSIAAITLLGTGGWAWVLGQMWTLHNKGLIA